MHRFGLSDLAGIAYVVVWNDGIDIVSHGGDDAHRATAVGIVTASGPIGFALGQGAGPPVAARFGWSAIFLVLTVVTLIRLAVFWPPSRGLGYSKGLPPTLGEFGSILRSGQSGLPGFLDYSLYLFANSWGSSSLTQEMGLLLELSELLVAVFPAVEIVAWMNNGILLDRCSAGGVSRSYPDRSSLPRRSPWPAADDCDAALGGDQGGSIRVPSAWCGLIGIKPTTGLVPYTGIFPINRGYDHTGPQAQSVEDAATILEIIAGEDI